MKKAVSELELRVTAATKKFDADMKRLDKKMKGVEMQSKKTTKSTAGLGKAFAGLAVVTVAVTAMKKFIEVAKIQEKAEQGVRTALINTGDATEETFQRMKKFAAEVQKVTTTGDEATLALMQMGLSLGVSTENIEEATKGTIGLSKAIGIDQKAAMRAVALAYQGEFTMLNRYIPAIRTASTNTEKMAILQRSMADGFKIATDEAKTSAGRMEQLSNTWGDIQETIGAALLPALEDLAEMLSEMSRDEELMGFFKDSMAMLTWLGKQGARILKVLIGLYQKYVKVYIDAFNWAKSFFVEEKKELPGIIKAHENVGAVLKREADERDRLAKIESEASEKRAKEYAAKAKIAADEKAISDAVQIRASETLILARAIEQLTEAQNEYNMAVFNAPALMVDATTAGQALMETYGHLAASIGGSFEALAEGGMKEVLKNVLNVLISFAEAELAVASAAAIFRSVFGDFSSLVQLGLGIAALETARGFVNSFAVGTDFVQRDQLAMVHRGEQIVPADQNTSGGGEGTANSRIGIQTREVRGDVSLTGQTFRTVKDSQMFESAQGVQ